MSVAPTPDPESGNPGSGDPDPLEGYVPQGEFDREQQRTRSFQAERDRLQAELDKLKLNPPAPAPPVKDENDDKGPSLGFDPDEFRRQVTRDAFHATSMARAAESLRTDFPHADDALFTPQRITEFGSVEAFKFAVEDSHKRVNSKITSERTKIEEEVRKEFAEKYGISVTPKAGEGDGLGAPAGDPTPEALARMTNEQWDELEKKNPGVISRVLTKQAVS